MPVLITAGWQPVLAGTLKYARLRSVMTTMSNMPKIKQLIAFDFGLRQIGVATGNSVSNIASELCILNAKEGKPNWHEMETILKEWQPQLCLVGLPLNMDGTESELSAKARKFARQIEGRFSIKIEMIDERLSSFEAKGLAREEGHKGNYKAAPIDALAARILVTQWLNNSPEG